MNEEERPPFFINIKRRQRADSYFDDIGRTHEKLRKLIEASRNFSTDVLPLSCNDQQDLVPVRFYGVQRYISLEPDPTDEDAADKDFIEVDEDVQFVNTSAFSLFWMTFKRIALTIGEQISSYIVPCRESEDEENNRDREPRMDDLRNIMVDPPYRDRRITQSKIVYGDLDYMIQKFRMDLNCGSVDIGLFSVELPQSCAEKFDATDLQAYVVSPECGSFVWIENGKASAIFLTKSSSDFFGNVMEWFRKILSDMALADSVMIGHPYYWHAPVRRRLSRVMKYLKRLYRTLALKEQQRNAINHSVKMRTDAIAVICPKNISKIVINEQPSKNLRHTSSTYDQLNIMVDGLVKKWCQYQQNLEQSLSRSLTAVSRAWAADNPQSINRKGGKFLESVTFLKFNQDELYSDDSEIASCSSDNCLLEENNNVYSNSTLDSHDTIDENIKREDYQHSNYSGSDPDLEKGQI